jgi:hypothetical protein
MTTIERQLCGLSLLAYLIAFAAMSVAGWAAVELIERIESWI